MSLTQAEAAALDRADPLARFRDRFDIGPRYAAYMDGNSLGRPPKAAEGVVLSNVEKWTESLILGWRDWIKLPHLLGDRIAEHVIGAEDGEVLVSDSTTVNLYKAAVAAIEFEPNRTRIVTTSDNFPTDLYVLESVARQFGKDLLVLPADDVEGVDVDELARNLDGGTALVALSHVAYKSGALLDLPTITEMVHDAGATMLWDLSHSAGSVPIALRETAPVLAVGCTYKYLNGGPGSPAFVHVPRSLQTRMRQPIWGWFGHRSQFEMRIDYDPADSIDQFLTGAPSILSLSALDAGLDLIAEAGVGALYAKSQKLTDLLIEGVDAIGSDELEVASPRAASARGSHMTVRHQQAKAVVRRLIAAGVIPDFRPPDLIRFGPAPLYTRFVDIVETLDRLEEALAAA